MTTFNPQDYGPTLAPLLDTDRNRALDAGSPQPDAKRQLQQLSVETTFDGRTVADPQLAACTIAGIWLLYDFLDESHTVSQSVETSEGSFWHGIMHRREGDFSNAKYWFRRAGTHPIFPDLLAAAQTLAAGHNADGVLPLDGNWDPMAMVDACQAATRGQGNAAFFRDVQQREWELLFDYCYRGAVGESP